MYQRIENAYGSKISDTGLPSEAFDISFFLYRHGWSLGPNTTCEKSGS
jgi:hypothetical protein